MAEPTPLADRINAEFASAEQKIKQMQAQQAERYQNRQQRQEKLEQTLEANRDVWRPRESSTTGDARLAVPSAR